MFINNSVVCQAKMQNFQLLKCENLLFFFSFEGARSAKKIYNKKLIKISSVMSELLSLPELLFVTRVKQALISDGMEWGGVQRLDERDVK